MEYKELKMILEKEDNSSTFEYVLDLFQDRNLEEIVEIYNQHFHL